MKKLSKMIAFFLAAVLMVSALAGCAVNGQSSSTAAPAADTAEAEEAEAGNDDEPVGSGTITLWISEELVDFTKEQAEGFIAANPKYSGFTINVEAVGTGEATTNAVADVQGAADIFVIAQDQLSRCVSAGAAMPITGEYNDIAKAENDEGSYEASSVGGQLYGFPLTSDNGYYLMYDKSVVSDPTHLEDVIADCEAAGRNFYFGVSNAWYQSSIFFATGCMTSYDIDVNAKFTGCESNYASDAGLIALKKWIEICSSTAFQNGYSVSDGTNIGAIIDGIWDAGAAQQLWGDNYAAAKLPVFTGSDGKEYQMSGFGGYKLLVVKPQEDAAKLEACLKIAQYLASEEGELDRFRKFQWGPSNKNAQQNEEVLANESLVALAEQLQYSVPQGNYPNDYWALGTSLGDDIAGGVINADNTDEELMEVLQKFDDSCKSYVEN